MSPYRGRGTQGAHRGTTSLARPMTRTGPLDLGYAGPPVGSTEDRRKQSRSSEGSPLMTDQGLLIVKNTPPIYYFFPLIHLAETTMEIYCSSPFSPKDLTS